MRAPALQLSTVPFPTSDEEPKAHEGVDDWVLDLGADGIYSIYKNLLDVLWAETKSQQNIGVRQKIIRHCTVTNNSKLSPDLAALVSALDSQKHLTEIALELSLEDGKISETLSEDRRNIRALLISTQQEILGGSKEVHSRLLDLVQDVLDDSHTRDMGDTRLHRLVVKLCSSCGRLPSSLFVQGVERRAEIACDGGGFSDIYKAIHKSQEVALKKLRIFVNNTDEERRKIQERFFEEALLWKNLNHTNILPFIGLHSYASDLNEPLSMVMVCPWMPNGTIIKYLKDFSETPIDAKVLEIAQGLNYLHSIPVVHGDLRGSNILVDAEGHARLADFGLACYADATAKSSARRGSAKWMAPELFQPPSHFQRTRSTDVYAFACVINELYNGASDTRSDTNVLFDVIAGRRPFRLLVPSRIWKVVEASWCQEPEVRLKIGEILERLQRIRQDDIVVGTSTEPQPKYKPPGALGITLKQNAHSTLALTRTPSITVAVFPNVQPPNRTRRNSFWDFFKSPHSADHTELNWRGGTRAISGLFGKGKTDPSAIQPAAKKSGTVALIKRPW
ncbi:kinase-like domain-containing protein [Mycena alexandri]|uniref:Kinase-like domain-containing protein n=1 Tax=Mycena alexandri TaxID=1745969 RepID=A0AAD6WU98_9AGAR|nr:kinase-like domain-containing protein [Mycena alexandri]